MRHHLGRLRGCLIVQTIGALLAGLLVLAGPTSSATGAFYASAWSPDRVLRSGCRGYRFTYRVANRFDDWTLEVFLVSPTGDGVASRALTSQAWPNRASPKFRVCRTATRYGKHKIRARLVWYTTECDLLGLHCTRERHTRWVEPTYFRFTRP